MHIKGESSFGCRFSIYDRQRLLRITIALSVFEDFAAESSIGQAPPEDFV